MEPVIIWFGTIVGIVAGVWQLAEYANRLKFKDKAVLVIDREDADRGGGFLGLGVFRWNNKEVKFYVARINDMVFKSRDGTEKSLTAVDFAVNNEDTYDALTYLKDHASNQNEYKIIDNGKDAKWVLDVGNRNLYVLYYNFDGSYLGKAINLQLKGGTRYVYRFRQTDGDSCHLAKSDQRAIIEQDL